MGYIEDNLMEDESVVLNTRLHPIVLLVPAMGTSFLAGSLWYYPQMFPNNEDGYIAFTVILLLLAYSSYRLCDRLIVFLTSEFAVTSKRVLGKTGFIRRKSLDIVLAKVEAIEVTGSGGTEEVLSFIPAPLEFRKTIQEQLSLLEQDVGGERTTQN